MTFDEIRQKQDTLFQDFQRRIDTLLSQRPDTGKAKQPKRIAWLEHDRAVEPDTELEQHNRLSDFWRKPIFTGRRDRRQTASESGSEGQ